MKVKTKNKYIRSFIIGVIMVILLAACAVVYYLLIHNRSESEEPKVEMSKTETEKKKIQEIQENPEKKLENSQQDVPKPPTAYDNDDETRTRASVLVTNVGAINQEISASGFAINITEEGGGCSFYFQQGDKIIQKSTSTLVNPSSTTCVTVRFPANELGSGVWQVWLRYDSNNYTGVSDKMELVL